MNHVKHAKYESNQAYLMLKSRKIYTETCKKIKLNQVFSLSQTHVITVIQSQITLSKILFC